MKALPLIIALTSCGGPQEPEIGWQPLTGTEYVSPKNEIHFWGRWSGGAYVEWASIDFAKFSGNLDPFTRLQAIRGIDIQLFTGSAVTGNTTDLNLHTLAIYWPWRHQVDAAMAAPYHWDAGLEVWSVGLQCLRHEWSHVLHGAYHP